MTASATQVRQWSEEVAADRGSLSFLPLAQAYRAGFIDFERGLVGAGA